MYARQRQVINPRRLDHAPKMQGSGNFKKGLKFLGDITKTVGEEVAKKAPSLALDLGKKYVESRYGLGGGSTPYSLQSASVPHTSHARKIPTKGGGYKFAPPS